MRTLDKNELLNISGAVVTLDYKDNTYIILMTDKNDKLTFFKETISFTGNGKAFLNDLMQLDVGPVNKDFHTLNNTFSISAEPLAAGYSFTLKLY